MHILYVTSGKLLQAHELILHSAFKHMTAYNSAISLWGTRPTDTLSYEQHKHALENPQQSTNNRIKLETILTPIRVPWINECWNIHTMEYDKALRILIPCDNMKESYKHHTEWKNTDKKKKEREYMLYVSIDIKYKMGTAHLCCWSQISFAGRNSSIWKGAGLGEEHKFGGVWEPLGC